MLDIWPPFLISIRIENRRWQGVNDDNIIAALEYSDRVCEIDLSTLLDLQLEMFLSVTQQPFPALTSLVLGHRYGPVSVVPDSFLGGSAPGLRNLSLLCIPFPGLPKLLLSSTHLVDLRLWRIPHSGYFPPEAMVSCLSVLTRLGTLELDFESSQSRPDQRIRCPHPPTRILLPVLTDLCFKGVREYLEALVAQIDAPLLEMLEITLFHEPIIDIPQFTQFISRTPIFGALDNSVVESFYPSREVSVTLRRAFYKAFKLGISYDESALQLSSLADLCSSFPQGHILAVEHLYVTWDELWHWEDVIENREWLELLHQFNSVKSLYICQEAVPYILPPLQELAAERVTEVLPALQTLFFRGTSSRTVQDRIGQFVAARQLSGHPVAISCWE
jgi:hypothetical protein